LSVHAPGAHEPEPPARDVRGAGEQVRQAAEEQAALHRVAVLVARGEPPEAVFAAVADETRRLLSSEATLMSRYDPDDAATIVGASARTDTTTLPPVGTRLSLGGRDLHTLVFRTGQSARIDDYGDASEATVDIARKAAVRSAVGVPISVGGRLWGIIGITSCSKVPVGAEETLTGFTELLATAIANTEARLALTASRARIVAAAATRRRIERNLHDGAQQRLVSLGLRLRAELPLSVTSGGVVPP
jgi:GAF domain-containing protein